MTRPRHQPAFRGDFPPADRDISAALRRAPYDGTTWEWTGASGAGLRPGDVYGPPGLPRPGRLAIEPAAPEPPPPPRPDRIGQLWQAMSFLRFRASLGEDEDAVTVARAIRVLRAGPDAPLCTSVWGLDPDDPEENADFSDVARSLDEWAQAIHGKHAGGPR